MTYFDITIYFYPAIYLSTQRDRDRDRETERQRQRDRETERDRERQRETDLWRHETDGVKINVAAAPH